MILSRHDSVGFPFGWGFAALRILRAPRLMATFCQPSGLTDPECPNSSLRRIPVLAHLPLFALFSVFRGQGTFSGGTLLWEEQFNPAKHAKRR